MVATTFIRSGVRQRIIDLVQAEVDSDIEVFRNEPRDWPDTYIWLGPTLGDIDYPAMAPVLPRDDRFSIIVICSTTVPGDSAGAAEERAEQMANAVLTAVSTDPVTADPLDGLDGVFEVTVASVDGPMAIPSDEGYGAVYELTIDVLTRIVRP